ncbi:MAG: geranylgeranylglycerol-phosphate geranylgeranyltransferase [Candidatus Zixiibacteriota bacterium]
MRRFIDILRLIRATNCLIASAGVWVGAYLTWSWPEYYGPTVVSIAAFLACAAGNILNDLMDTEADKINRPTRVLVAGRLSRRFARNLMITLNVIALIMGIAVSWEVALTGFVTIGLLVAYNRTLKRIPLLGNAVVALLASLTFVTGGLAIDPELTFRLPGPMIASVFAFFFHLVREIVKDVQDMEGDRRAGLSSLPLVIGPSRSLLAATGLFALLAVLTYIPIFAGWFGRAYEIITVYVVDLPILALLVVTWGFPDAKMLAVASRALKVGMILGLLALILA